MVMGLGAYYLLGVSYTGGGSFGYPLNFNTSIIHTWIKSAINGGGVGEGDASMPRGMYKLTKTKILEENCKDSIGFVNRCRL